MLPSFLALGIIQTSLASALAAPELDFALLSICRRFALCTRLTKRHFLNFKVWAAAFRTYAPGISPERLIVPAPLSKAERTLRPRAS